MAPLLLLLAPASSAAAMIAAAREAVAGPRCSDDSQSSDITVCGRRHADRYRVPFVVHDPADPRFEAVAVERARLLHRTTPLQDLSPFLVGGGMAGVHTMIGGDGSVRTEGLRRLAP